MVAPPARDGQPDLRHHVVALTFAIVLAAETCFFLPTSCRAAADLMMMPPP